MRVFFYRLSNIVRQFFNRPLTYYTRIFFGAYGGYGATGAIAPVGGIQEPPPPETVHSFWIGHVSSTGFVVTGKISNPRRTDYELNVTTDPNFGSYTGFTRTRDNFGVVRWESPINSPLSPNTRYYIRVRNTANGSIIGTFKTAPVGFAQSFTFGFGSCSKSCPPDCDAETPFNTGSNSRLYDNIKTKAENNQLDFFIHLGDMHYRDITINEDTYYQEAFDSVFKAQRQRDCWSKLPMYYMWDDHDYGANDTDKNSPSRLAAVAAYRHRVPYPTLAYTGETEQAPYYSFVRGRVRFIVTDIRSEREPKGTYPSTNANQQVFGNLQKTWFQNQLLEAKAANQIIVWANTKPWVSAIQNNKDDWGGYHYARMEIVNFINANNLADRIVIISGDMHALAYDNGTSPNNYGNLKVCHAGPLDQQIRYKGGPYTSGPIANTGLNGTITSAGSFASQYGIMEITDTGGTMINVVFRSVQIYPTNDNPAYEMNGNIAVSFDLNTGYIPPPTDPYAEYTTLLLNFD